MTSRPDLLTEEFRALSAALGSDPLQVQGPGGNTSIKDNEVMWIKASGTELANAANQQIFVAVNRADAVAEANGKAGDGSCKTTVIDPSVTLRPSIETTFHAALNWPVVCHTHSVATLVHAISPEGRNEALSKLDGLPFVIVGYAKPGLPLTQKILEAVQPETQVIILQNHGLICCGESVAAVNQLIAEVERRLHMSAVEKLCEQKRTAPQTGFEWATGESWIAHDSRACTLAVSGSYYPDHVVFLGPALPQSDGPTNPPAIVLKDQGILVRDGATSSQIAMLKCLSDILIRLPEDWNVEPIGPEGEAELLNWDAEKYRQALAKNK